MVTGASGGIGLELARCLAAKANHLVLVARSTEKLERAAREIGTAHGTDCTVLACDLAASGAVAGLTGQLDRLGLRVDVLVNNAGYGIVDPLASADMARQLDMVRLNVLALTELTGQHLPGMIERGAGGVLNVSSMAAFAPVPFMAAYAASKAYVLSFSQALWEETRGTGVTVSCLCPGSTQSGFHDRAGTDKVPSSKVSQMSAADVARTGVDGFLRGQREIVPGKSNALVRRVLGVVPTSLALKGMRKAFET